MAALLRRFARSVGANRYPALVTLSAFAVYFRTLSPTVMWHDRAEFALGAHVLGIAHNTGYPLYMMLGKLFTFLPVGDIAYRVNLMSAVFAALTVLVITLIVRRITHREFPAFVAGATVALGSTFWANALWAEPHTLNAFLTVLIVYLLVVWREGGRSRYLYISFLIFGLGLGNHRLIVAVFPAMLAFALLSRKGSLPSLRWRPLLLIGLLLLAGFSVNAYLPIRAMQAPHVQSGDPSSIEGFVKMVFLGSSTSRAYDFSPADMWARKSVLWDYPRFDFTVLGLVLAFVGVATVLRKDRPLLVLTLVPSMLTAFIIVTYKIHDIFDYFIPIHLMLGIWLGVGVHQAILWAGSVSEGMFRVRVRVLTPLVRRYALNALVLALPLGLFLSNFHRLDRSQDYEAYDFAVNAMSMMPQNAVVVADWWTYHPLFYQQVVNRVRRDLGLTEILSTTDFDSVSLVELMLNEGEIVYVAEGVTADSIELSQKFTLLPVALQAITAPLTRSLPLPEYKDLLVAKRSLYRVVREKPPLQSGRVPQGSEKQITFGGTITLQGLVIREAEVERGSSFATDYYWRLDRDTEEALHVWVRFVDEQGRAQLKQGFPLWFQAYQIGGGIHPTSEWKPGQTSMESYQTLVPRQLRPGTYYLKLSVYDSVAQTRELVPSSHPSGGGVIVGEIRVN